MKDRRFGWLARGPFALDATRPSSPVEEATSAVVSVTFRRSRLAPLVTEVYISLVSHESLTERGRRARRTRKTRCSRGEQEHWANDGINSAHENPKTSQPGNSLLQESDAVAETEEVTLWEDDLTEPDTFGEDVCKDIETLKNDAKHLDDLNQICADVLQQVSTGTPFGALCAVVQDANNKFDQVFPCNDLQVAQWLVNRLSDVFCTTAAPSG